jgi:hypothetical protein
MDIDRQEPRYASKIAVSKSLYAHPTPSTVLQHARMTSARPAGARLSPRGSATWRVGGRRLRGFLSLSDYAYWSWMFVSGVNRLSLLDS